jgi:hypothetical protein
MSKYIITVIQLVETEDLHKYDDRIDNPTGEYFWIADDADTALTQFHHTIPIGCVDDFAVDIEPVTNEELLLKMINKQKENKNDRKL